MMRRLLLLFSLLGISASSLYGIWQYTVSVAKQGFEADILKVKQSFYEGVKSLENIAVSLKTFCELESDLSQKNFGHFSGELISLNKALTNITYYKHISQDERANYETHLTQTGLGTTVLEGGVNDTEIGLAAQRGEYFVSHAVNEQGKDHAYFGWDLLSDASKLAALQKARETGDPVASEPYLLDNGHGAFDIFIRVMGHSPESELMGMISISVDLTMLLGEDKWREGVTIILSTILSGTDKAKNIYRQLDKEIDQKWVFQTLSSSIDVEKFGQDLGLTFEKGLIRERLNFWGLGIALFGLLILGILALYLLITYEKLEKSLRDIAEANATLERKVEERTKELAFAYKEITEILDNLDDLVITTDGDLRVGGIFSPASRKILDREEIGGSHLVSLLFGSLDKNDEPSSRHLFALSMLKQCDDFQWEISSNELLKILQYPSPKDGCLKTLSLRYSPIFDGDTIRKLVVVASDVTEILSLRASLAEQEKASHLSQHILTELAAAEKSQLKGFFEESFARSKRIAGDWEEKVTLRELHTLKGSARSMGLRFLAKGIHEAENRIGEGEGDKAAVMGEECGRVVALFGEYHRFYREIFAANSQDRSGKAFLEKIHGMLDRKGESSEGGESWVSGIKSWVSAIKEDVCFSFSDLFLGFSKGLEEIGESMGKRIGLIPFGEDIYFAKEIQPALSEALTHALRNALDHGIETVEERKRDGKPERGEMRVRWLQTSTHGTIEIADDGRGINLERVYAMARKKGLVSKAFAEMGKGEILELLFAHGFSTKEEVSELSGRGVGLDAVRSSCGDWGITCEMDSHDGKGSTFRLVIPNKWACFSVGQDFAVRVLG